MLHILNSFGAALAYFLRGECMGFGGGTGTNPPIGGGDKKWSLSEELQLMSVR